MRRLFSNRSWLVNILKVFRFLNHLQVNEQARLTYTLTLTTMIGQGPFIPQ